MITPSFDFATRLAELADDLERDKELLPVEYRTYAYHTAILMQDLAVLLHPAIFDKPEEPAEAFSPHVMILGGEP